MSRNITPCGNHSYWLQLTNQTPPTQGPTQPIFLWLEIKCMEEERGGKGNRVGEWGGGGAWEGKGTVQAFRVPTLPDRPPASPGESPAGTTPARQRRVPTVPDAKGHPQKDTRDTTVHASVTRNAPALRPRWDHLALLLDGCSQSAGAQGTATGCLSFAFLSQPRLSWCILIELFLKGLDSGVGKQGRFLTARSVIVGLSARRKLRNYPLQAVYAPQQR